VATLPDKGEKLRATNVLIDTLLAQLCPDGSFQTLPSTTIEPEQAGDDQPDEGPLMDALSKLSLKAKENGREHCVALANAEACNNQFISSGMMRTRKSSVAEGSNGENVTAEPSTVCIFAAPSVEDIDYVIKCVYHFLNRMLEFK
jgi:hypothetical protein